MNFSEISVYLPTRTPNFGFSLLKDKSMYHGHCRQINVSWKYNCQVLDKSKVWVSLQKFEDFFTPSSSLLKLKGFLEQVFLQHISNYADKNQHEEAFNKSGFNLAASLIWMEFLIKLDFKYSSSSFLIVTPAKINLFESQNLLWLWIFANSLDFYRL